MFSLKRNKLSKLIILFNKKKNVKNFLCSEIKKLFSRVFGITKKDVVVLMAVKENIFIKSFKHVYFIDKAILFNKIILNERKKILPRGQ